MSVLDSFSIGYLCFRKHEKKVTLFFQKKVQCDVWKKKRKILKRDILSDYEGLSHFILVNRQN